MNEAIKKNGIKFGLISAVISIVLTVLMYAIDINLFANSYIGIGMVFFYLALGIYVVSTTKKESNGFISFKDSFTTLTITSTTGILITQIFTFLLNNFIDAEYGRLLYDFFFVLHIVAANAMKSFTEISTEDLKEIAKTNNFSIIKILQGSAMAFLISSIMNLILSAIFKSKTNTLNE